MKLSIKGSWMNALIKRSGHATEEHRDAMRWRNEDNWLDLSADRFSDEALAFLAKTAMADRESGKPVEGAVGLNRKITTYLRLKADPVGQPINRLEPLATALKEYIGRSPHKWLFGDTADGQTVPYYVYNIEYTPPDPKNGNPASTDIELAAQRRGGKQTRTVSFMQNDLTGRTPVELLSSRGFYLETTAAVAEWEQHMAVWKEISPLTGVQFQASGYGFYAGNGWRRDEVIALMREQQPARVVMDDAVEQESSDDGHRRTGRHQEVHFHSSAFWSPDATKKKHRDDPVDESTVELPIHPHVRVFDLRKHQFVVLHVANLVRYAYDKALIDKLILPPHKKELVGILIQGAEHMMDDIVKGKTGGIVVIATGPPGTGKTLTAEVFSEAVEKPLYEVQCSQLGTSETALEKELDAVLERAARWKAILLIDEADVYVHERGDDIQQNAIVGVWLRVLEHYRGILFMTSNRSTIIDDAVMSRATAWIRYDYPTDPEAIEIWRVLAENYQVELNVPERTELVQDFTGISGRSIKNLLRLAKLMAERKGRKVLLGDYKYVSQFLDLERDEKRKAQKQ